MPEDCFQQLPELCAATVLFDILIANGDRSRSNLSLDESGHPTQMRLFDHEMALLGATAGQAEGRLIGSLRNETGIPDHCLKSLVPVHRLMESDWMQRIWDLPAYLIEQACREAAPYGMTPEETEAVISFLTKRRHNLYDLVRDHEAEFFRGHTGRRRP